MRHVTFPATDMPQCVAAILALPVEDRHRALQLILREIPYAEDAADLFLTQWAGELRRDEQLQDELYPIGRCQPDTLRRHYEDAAAFVTHAEQRIAGREAMLCGRVAMADPGFYGKGVFGG